MADEDQVPENVEVPHEGDEEDCNYKPPPEMTLKEILDKDKEDESLRKYKETLLGNATEENIIIDPNDPRKVIVRDLELVVYGRPSIVLDLSGDLTNLKKQIFTIKEGIQYRVRINFHVQREIVTGLKYIQKVYRKGIQMDKMQHMVGSYAPRKEVHSCITPLEDAPSGLMARGTYTVKSLFTDDDKHEHLKWEWAFEIKKDWD